MVEKNIFPEDILNNTLEYHTFKYSKKSSLIFWIIFLSLLTFFLALPFIYVDIYSTSRGIITSEEKSVMLYAPTSGRITYFNLVENAVVTKGDTLLIISQKKLDYREELLNSQKENIQDFIIAPISGELINIKGFSKESYITSGANLAKISPNERLIIESYVTPYDIGYIKEGIGVKYQIDSYNSNQWGFATGVITDVGKDVIQINNTNIFKVRSSLNEKELSLSNGTKGKLKKGMTVTSRFFLNRKSLFQLLFNRINDWFNPYYMKDEKNRN